MIARWRAAAVVVAASLGAMAAPGRAHELTTGTARVTLRDGHVDVTADLDLFLVVARAPTAIATAPDADVAEALAAARRTIERETAVDVDGQRYPVTLRDAPTVPELRAVAAVLSASGRDHGELVRLRLELMASARGAQTIGLTLPAAFGPTVVSFVQPATQHVGPATAARFTVLTARPSGAAGGGASPAIGGLGAVGGAVVALGLAWLVGRRRAVSA